MAFGCLHSLTPAGSEPDWERAEQHWRELVTFVLKRAAPTSKSTRAAALRWAENATADLLLTFHAVPGSRCPICTGLTGA
ncbi:hypothetical protein GCM10009663_57010 [Kitasatospora arboriphila]|uniref:Transposase n=2 Tax=Kitasatospora arboriphila TaxID=258052 RepID=A0ABN1TXL2_9ACTN